MEFLEKHVGDTFEKIPLRYFWVYSGILPASFFMIFYIFTTPNALNNFNIDWILVGLALSGTIMAFTMIMSVGLGILTILLVLTLKTARKNEWMPILAMRLKNLLQKSENETWTEEELHKIIGEEFENILKKYNIIPNKPTKEAFTEIFERLSNIEIFERKYEWLLNDKTLTQNNTENTKNKKFKDLDE